jgi:phosphoglycerate dehydrogenase-like enzyme
MASILIAHHDSARYAEVLAPELAGLDVRLAPNLGAAGAALADAEIIMAGGPGFNEAIIAGAPKVAWIQALTTGTDGITNCRNLPAGLLITSARGIHGPQMSELTLLLMLALTRRFPRMLANQGRRKWEKWPQSILSGKTVAILGVGAIAVHLAPCLKAFGLTVLGISRSDRPVAGFDRIYGRDRIREVAGMADYFIVLVPHSPETDRIVDRSVFAAMRPAAFFINVARGGVVDEAALVDALRAGRIAGAGLDVFATEPLPEQSPLWEMDNVIITPKVGGMTDVYVEQTAPMLKHNLRAYREGRRSDLVNVVARTPSRIEEMQS